MKGQLSRDKGLEESIEHRIGDRGRAFLDEYQEQIKAISDSEGGSYYDKAALRVGIITDDFMWNYYDGAVDLVYLDPEGYRGIIDGDNLDMVLYVTCWRGMGTYGGSGKPEDSHYYGEDGLERAAAVLKYARSQGVSVVFQSIEDPPSYERFLPLAKLAVFIFTSAEEKVPCYIHDASNPNVSVLKYGVNPRFHNPIGMMRKRTFRKPWNVRGCLFAGSWYKAYPARCASTRRLFDAVLSAGSELCIADRNFRELAHASWAFPLDYSRHVVPAFGHEELQKVHKLFDFTLNLNTVTYSRTMCAMRMFEVQALGGLVLSNYSRSASLMFPGVFQAYSEADVERILNGYTEDELLNMQVEGVRSLWSEHTVYDRLNEMRAAMGRCQLFSPQRIACVCEDGEYDELIPIVESQTYSDAVLVRRSEAECKVASFEGLAFATILHAKRTYPRDYLQDLANAFKYADVAYVRYASELDGAFEYEQGIPDASSGLVDLRKISLDSILRGCYESCLGFRVAGGSWGRDTSHEEKLIGVAIPIVGGVEPLAKRCFRSLLRSSVFSKMRIVFLSDAECDAAAVSKAYELAGRFDNVSCSEAAHDHSRTLESFIYSVAELFEDLPFFGIIDSNSEAINDGYAALLQELEAVGADAAVASSSLPHEKLGAIWEFEEFEQVSLSDRGDAALFRQGVTLKNGYACGNVRLAANAVATVRHEGGHVCEHRSLAGGFAFDASVIIRAKGSDRCLSRCLTSVAAQTACGLRIQAIILDNGTDDDAARAAAVSPFEDGEIMVLQREGSGLLASLNRSIKHVQGEFIFFLDADDALMPGTIFSVVDFMRANADRIDVSAYPLLCVEGEEKKQNPERIAESVFGATGVYELKDNPYLPFASVNVCVRSSLPIKFDEALATCSGWRYVVECLSFRERMGYVREAGYVHLPLSDDALKTNRNVSGGSYADVIAFSQFLEDTKRRQPNLSEYCDGVILRLVDLLNEADIFLPRHPQKGHNYEMLGQLKSVIEGVSGKTLNACPYLGSFFKAWLVRLHGAVDFLAQGDTVCAVADNQLLFSSWKVCIAISVVRVEGDRVRICGHFDDVPGLLMEPARLFAVLNDSDRIAVPLFRSAFTYSKTKPLETPGFDFSFNHYFISSIAFEVEYRGLKIGARLSSFSPWTGVSPSIRRPYVDCGDVTLILSNDTIQIRPRDGKWPNMLREKYEAQLKLKKKRTRRLRRLVKAASFVLRECWLYNDSRGALQDAYLQFKHDLSKSDGVARYYVYKGEAPRGIPDAERRYMVRFGSNKHKMLLFSASLIITSCADGRGWMPFSSEQMPYYLDIMHASIVYVGDGVMRDNPPCHLDREILNWADRIVVSTTIERDVCIEYLHYRASDLLCTGAPRLNNVPQCTSRKRVVAVDPCWQEDYVSRGDGMQNAVSLFRGHSTNFWIRSLSSSPTFLRFLEKNDLICRIRVTSDIAEEEKGFAEVGNSRVRFVDSIDPDECLLVITDYSPRQLDYLARGCPVVYYLSDRENLSANLYGCQKALFDAEKGFGEQCETVEECVNALDRLRANAFVPLPEYQQCLQGLFLGPADHRRALYEQLRMVSR